VPIEEEKDEEASRGANVFGIDPAVTRINNEEEEEEEDRHGSNECRKKKKTNPAVTRIDHEALEQDQSGCNEDRHARNDTAVTSVNEERSGCNEDRLLSSKEGPCGCKECGAKQTTS